MLLNYQYFPNVTKISDFLPDLYHSDITDMKPYQSNYYKKLKLEQLEVTTDSTVEQLEVTTDSTVEQLKVTTDFTANSPSQPTDGLVNQGDSLHISLTE